MTEISLYRDASHESAVREEAVRLDSLLEQVRTLSAPSELLVRACLDAAHQLAGSARNSGLDQLGEAAASLEAALEQQASGGSEADRQLQEAGTSFSQVVYQRA